VGAVKGDVVVKLGIECELVRSHWDVLELRRGPMSLQA
jgi:hypothetical protein